MLLFYTLIPQMLYLKYSDSSKLQFRIKVIWTQVFKMQVCTDMLLYHDCTPVPKKRSF